MFDLSKAPAAHDESDSVVFGRNSHSDWTRLFGVEKDSEVYEEEKEAVG
jgi:hypothetical protein